MQLLKWYIKVQFVSSSKQVFRVFGFIFLDKEGLFVKNETNLDNDRVLRLVAGQHK